MKIRALARRFGATSIIHTSFAVARRVTERSYPSPTTPPRDTRRRASERHSWRCLP